MQITKSAKRVPNRDLRSSGLYRITDMSNSIIAIGRAVSILHAMPNRIRAAAGELGISPAIKINGVEHFDETDVDRIGRHLEQTSTPQAAGASNV